MPLLLIYKTGRKMKDLSRVIAQRMFDAGGGRFGYPQEPLGSTHTFIRTDYSTNIMDLQGDMEYSVFQTKAFIKLYSEDVKLIAECRIDKITDDGTEFVKGAFASIGALFCDEFMRVV